MVLYLAYIIMLSGISMFIYMFYLILNIDFHLTRTLLVSSIGIFLVGLCVYSIIKNHPKSVKRK